MLSRIDNAVTVVDSLFLNSSFVQICFYIVFSVVKIVAFLLTEVFITRSEISAYITFSFQHEYKTITAATEVEA